MLRALLLTSVLAAAFMPVPTATAEGQGDFLAELEGFRSQLLEDRRELVRKGLELTTNEAAAFQPVYEAYQEEVEGFRRRRLNLVLDFLENRGSYDRAESIARLRDWLAMKQDWARLEREWLGEFLSVLPAGKVMRYYQIENKIDAVINAELASFVPLAGTGEQG